MFHHEFKNEEDGSQSVIRVHAKGHGFSTQLCRKYTRRQSESAGWYQEKRKYCADSFLNGKGAWHALPSGPQVSSLASFFFFNLTLSIILLCLHNGPNSELNQLPPQFRSANHEGFYLIWLMDFLLSPRERAHPSSPSPPLLKSD